MHSMFALILAALLAQINWLSYTDAADRFTIKYPENWEKNVTTEYVTFLSAVESDSDAFRENVNVVVQDLSQQPTTMAEYTQATKDWISESKGVLQLEREIQFAGNAATEVAYTMPANSIGLDLELMFHQLWIIKDDKAYLLTYTAQPDRYEKFEAQAAEIFKSFVLEVK